jgi:hypothetical protein
MFKLRIERDEIACDPRKEFDHLGTMACSHKCYSLGDKNAKINVSACQNWDDVEDYLRGAKEAEVILPLYLYDHGGITMSTSPFGDRWDSGQVGFIYASRKRILSEYSVTEIAGEIFELVTKVLQAEVKEYDAFLTGEVYGYIIEDEMGEQVDSCWGFYGEKYAEEEGRAALASLEAEARRCALQMFSPQGCP